MMYWWPLVDTGRELVLIPFTIYPWAQLGSIFEAFLTSTHHPHHQQPDHHQTHSKPCWTTTHPDLILTLSLTANIHLSFCHLGGARPFLMLEWFTFVILTHAPHVFGKSPYLTSSTSTPSTSSIQITIQQLISLLCFAIGTLWLHPTTPYLTYICSPLWNILPTQ